MMRKAIAGHPARTSLARKKALLGSTVIVALALTLAPLASVASAKGTLSYGGPTSNGGRVVFSVHLKKKHHKLKLSVSGFSVTSVFKCTDGYIGPPLASPAVKGPMSKKGHAAFSGLGPFSSNGSGTQSGSIQLGSPVTSASGTFEANFSSTTHGNCDTGALTWTATVGG